MKNKAKNVQKTASEFAFEFLPVIIVFTMALSSLQCVQGQNTTTEVAPLNTVDYVNLTRYTGTWYEIAKIPNRFQRKCARNTTASYAFRNDGRLRVLNQCVRANGSRIEAEGIAKVVDNASNARLRVSFVRLLGVSLFWGDYWIIGLDEDYRYAIVGNPSRKYGWILSREPTMRDGVLQEVYELLREKGYNPEDFVLTIQTES